MLRRRIRPVLFAGRIAVGAVLGRVSVNAVLPKRRRHPSKNDHRGGKSEGN